MKAESYIPKIDWGRVIKMNHCTGIKKAYSTTLLKGGYFVASLKAFRRIRSRIKRRSQQPINRIYNRTINN